MPPNEPPTNVPELLAKVTKATGNIEAHRQAMAVVASQARQLKPAPPSEGVKQ